jgi:hypothetical protein
MRTGSRQAEQLVSGTLFIRPGERVDGEHQDVRRFATASREDLRRRWITLDGRNLLRKLTDAGFRRDVMEASLGRLYENYDLRGIPLRGFDLSNNDLHNVDFYAADLRNAKLVGCNLTNTHFSEADIRGADFSFSRMNDAFLDNAIYDLKTTFTGVDIRNVNFNLAALLEDQARTQQRIAHLKSRHPIFALLLFYTSNYGQSLGLWSIWVITVVIAFAAIYYSVPGITNGNGLIDAIYLSITTFTTLGIGDITPSTPLGKLVVTTEVTIGYLMGGLLIAILVRRLIGN